MTQFDTLRRQINRAFRPPRRGPGALPATSGVANVLGMPRAAMVAVTSAIYTVARLGRAGGLTDDVLVVTGREPVSSREFAEHETARWAVQG